MTSPLHRRHAAIVAILLAGGALSACSHQLHEVGPPAAASTGSAAAQYDAVIAALQHGDTKAAHKALRQISRHNPGDARARLLGETIDIDPVAMLGSHSFAYTLKTGDTLRALAGRYLGDADKFYALARYNHINVPEAIKPGQTIRIPGAAPIEHAPPPHVDRIVPKPEPHAPAAPPAKPAAPTPQANPALAAKYRAAGLRALSSGAVDRAVADLSRAAALDPSNPLIARDLDRAQRIRRTVRARKSK